ncbi:DUF6887 family protein [Nostoc sp.]|jgi:hypothetical protein|uniref:DUF6887 family protein n=2 Tax=Nostoc sp. TaxID=1180 RepID=UPI002FF145D6
MTEYMSLNESELRKYVIAHPQDEEAFQHFLNIMRAKPGRVITATNEQFEAEIRKRLAS